MKPPFVGSKVHGLGHVGVTVTDFEGAVKWYQENFNFLLVSEQVIDEAVAESLAELYGAHNLHIRLGFLRSPGGMVLEIFEFSPKGDKIPLEWNRPGYTHICINVRNLKEKKAELEARGVEFMCEIQSTAGADWVFLKDPFGNLIEMMDLKAQRLPLKHLGWVLGLIDKKGKNASYYA